MKKYLYLLILILFSVNLDAQNWEKVTEATYQPFNKIFFIDVNTGWLAGSSGTILKTTDGGHTWQPPANGVPTTNSVYSIYFVDANIGYAGCAHDVILKSTDGGDTWAELTFGSVDGNVRAIYFADTDNGWALSSTSKTGAVSHTTDGGSTWSEDLTGSAGDLEDMAFSGAGKGVCVGGGAGILDLYYTTDGTNWNKSANPTLPAVYSRTDARGAFMTDDTTAHVVGWGSSAAGLQPSIHLKSTDGGATWSYIEQAEENRTYVNLYTVSFKDKINGIALGGGSYEGSLACRTTDGGINWEIIDPPFGFSVKSVFSIGDNVWIAGSGGGIAHSSDFGDTWELLTDIPSITLYTFKFVSGNVAYAAGYGGAILKTTDKGNTWHGSYASADKHCPSIQDVFFLNENTGFLARNNRMVTKTTDGGATWTKILQDTNWVSATTYGVFFVNETVGYVVGKHGTGTSAFYKTTDGGANWSTSIGSFPDQLHSVFFFDENKGVVVGRNLLVEYTTDGGATWTNSTLNDLPSGSSSDDFGKVTFLDNNFGLISGDVLMKSEDGGATWTYVEIPILTKEIKSCYIQDELTWYVVSKKSIFKTSDGGANWTDITDSGVIDTYLYDLSIDGDGYLWVSAGTSQLFKTASPVTGVEDSKAGNAEEFYLAQNYPNPFNPTTVINYKIDKAGYVSLKVYDSLGRIIGELLNEYKPAGSYKINFKAGNDFSSGVYYYSLTNNGKTTTKKMILLR